MALRDGEPMLYGRSEQLVAIDRLLEEMRSGRAGALVLRGQAGIGKTALLDAAEQKASGARVLRVTGVESELELPFAALHVLLRPVLDEIGALPGRQAAALRGAFGMAEAAVADRFLVGLGVLSLVAELAEDRPVLVLVDDAQWVDRASADALVFAARRLYAERAAVLAAARDEPGGGLLGLPELRVDGLDREAAEQLLGRAGLVAAVRDQLIDEAGGNPLALIELSRGLSGPQRAGSVTPLDLPAASPAGRVQQALAARAAALPQPCRRAVLVAALAGLADLAEVSRAVAAAGGSLTDLAAAERAGLVRVAPAGVSFVHPLARAAVLADSDVAERTEAHRALASVFDGDRRAWHALARVRGRLLFEAGQTAEAARYVLDGAALLASADRGTAQAMAIQAVPLLGQGAGPMDPELARRAAAMMPPAGAGLVEFLQAVQRLQDGDTHAPIAVPAWPDRDPLSLFDTIPQLYFDIIRGDMLAVGRRAADMSARCRDTGHVGLLSYALVCLANAQFAHGEFLDATATAEEGLRVAADTGQATLTGVLASIAARVAAVTGDEQMCRARTAQVRDQSTDLTPADDRTRSLAGADIARALLDLGCGRYQSAWDRMQATTNGPDRHNPWLLYAYPDHVEAAVRAGQPGLAARPLAQFSTWAAAIGQRWASAVAARCAALTAADAEAEPLYQEAIAAHEGDGRPFEQARTRLLYGEWLRRNQRRAG